MKEYDVAIIGGGPAGLAAALAARRAGVSEMIILERENVLGGILNQCIHSGFGLHTFHEELTGPEYASRYVERVIQAQIPFELNATVLNINAEHEIEYVSPRSGLLRIHARAIVLAMGCRERPRGALNIPGTRPAGIYSAGTAQRLMNIEGYRVGREAVILGSGDIGLIMARRLTLEGAKVKAVAELMPYSSGLKRNIVQCLSDFNIPLLLSHTVVQIHGQKRLEGVTLAQVDEKRTPIAGTERRIDCDTLLLSVGLLPENELTQAMGAQICAGTGGPEVNNRLETSVEGVFACGNVLHVHDLVDSVSQEAERAGENAARYALSGRNKQGRYLAISAGKGVRYTVPQYLDLENLDASIPIRFRVTDVYKNRNIGVYINGKRVYRRFRRIMAPGEMEQIHLDASCLAGFEDIRDIQISTEVE